MICFLTSRIDIPGQWKLNTVNCFTDELKKCFPVHCKALHICSDPDNWNKMDFYASAIKSCFESSGFVFDSYYTLDSRNESHAKELIRSSDLLILAGGHVPTQNRFFRKLGLRELIEYYNGIIIGISAGSMNSADIVYSMPEEQGEAADPDYIRFLTGLGLTKTMLVPHYSDIKDEMLDGLRLFDDIACPDSIGKKFYAIPDGSYLYIKDGKEEIRGEAYLIKDGIITRISNTGDIVPL